MKYLELFHRLIAVYMMYLLANSALCHHEHEGATEEHDRLVFLNNASEHFVEEIFEQYANNKSKAIDFREFMDLLRKLHISKARELELENADRALKREKKGETTHHGHRHERQVESADSHDSEGTKKQNNTAEFLHFHPECIDGDHLLKLHQISKEKGISRKDFVQLCPSLVYQAQSGACSVRKENASTSYLALTEDSLKVWGYGILSITVISLSSLFAIAIIPLMGKAIYKKVMSFLVALAVGTLAGDALLHLIPHTFLDAHSGANHKTSLWKAFVIMSGIYAFFLVESFMRVRSNRRGNKRTSHHHHDDHQNTTKECHTHVPSPCQSRDSCGEPLIGSRLAGIHHCHSQEDLRSPITSVTLTESLNLGSLEYNDMGQDHKAETPGPDDKVTWETNEKGLHNGSDAEIGVILKDTVFAYDDIYRDNTPQTPCLHPGSPCPERRKSDVMSASTDMSETQEMREQQDDNHNHHHHRHHHHGDKEIGTTTSIATIAWMVIVSDGFHNFSDGLAVGAAFTSSLTNGLTTAIAVFCHELPHELGDFAILIKSGLTFKQALAYNMASAIISYIGLILGIALGNIDSSHSWVLALTAGMFLYISLVSMLPELCSYQSESDGYGLFLSQNIGIVTGVGIMLAIALTES